MNANCSRAIMNPIRSDFHEFKFQDNAAKHEQYLFKVLLIPQAQFNEALDTAIDIKLFRLWNLKLKIKNFGKQI